MKNWLRWAPRHPQPSAYRLPPPPGRARPGPLNAARPQGRLLLRSAPRPDQRHAHGPAPCGLGCRPPLDGTPSRALCTGPSGIVSRRLLAPPCGRRFQRHQLAVRATHPGHHPRHHGGLVVHQHVARPLASASPGPCSRPYPGPLSKNRAVHLSSTPRVLPAPRQSTTAIATSLRSSESLDQASPGRGTRPDQRRSAPVTQPRPGPGPGRCTFRQTPLGTLYLLILPSPAPIHLGAAPRPLCAQVRPPPYRPVQGPVCLIPFGPRQQYPTLPTSCFSAAPEGPPPDQTSQAGPSHPRIPRELGRLPSLAPKLPSYA